MVPKPGERLRLDIASRTYLLRSDVSHGHAQFDMQVPPTPQHRALRAGHFHRAAARGRVKGRSDFHV